MFQSFLAPGSKGDADLYVDTIPATTTYSSKHHSYYGASNIASIEQIEIQHVQNGPYVVTLKAAVTFNKVDLYAIASTTVLRHNLEVEQSGTSFHFTLPEEVVSQGRPVIIRAFDRNNHASKISLFMRHGSPVDISASLFDHSSIARSSSSTSAFTEIMICSPRHGTYYLWLQPGSISSFTSLFGHESRNVYLTYKTLLRPRVKMPE